MASIKSMECSFCHAPNLQDAIYCSSCGSPFCALSWTETVVYANFDGSVEVDYVFYNRTPIPIAVKALEQLDGTTLVAFEGPFQFTAAQTPQTLHIGKEYRVRRASILDKMVLVCYSRAHGDFKLLVPPIHLAPEPDITLVVNPDQSGRRGSNPSTAPVPLRPSENYQLRVAARLNNQSLLDIQDIRLEHIADPEAPVLIRHQTRDVIRIRDAQGDIEPLRDVVDQGRSHTTAYIVGSLSPAAHEQYGRPTYRLTLTFQGSTAPQTIDFQLSFLALHEFQVLIERPTSAGVAYLGETAIMERDLSRERLERGAGLSTIDGKLKEVLINDFLVHQTLADLVEKRIVWKVPRNVVRNKRIAIERLEDVPTKAMDTLSYMVTCVLGGESIFEAGPFIAAGLRPDRVELDITLPPLEQTTTGILEVRYLELERKIRYEVEVEVFARRVFEVPVGIDFGTTNSCVALSLPTPGRGGIYGLPPILPTATILIPGGPFSATGNASIIPTCIQYVDDTTYVIGNGVDTDPAAVYKEFKLDLQRNTVTNALNQERDPVEVTKDFLLRLLRNTVGYLEERGIDTSLVKHITCSVPNTFSPDHREGLLSAYRAALNEMGVSEPSFMQLDESLAAVIYARQSELEEILRGYESRPVLVLIYDFGGGTTDITVMLVQRNEVQRTWDYTEIASGGNPELGGSHVTAKLAQELFRDDTDYEALAAAEIIKKNFDPGYTKERNPRYGSAYQFEHMKAFDRKIRLDMGISSDTSFMGGSANPEDEAVRTQVNERIGDAFRAVQKWLNKEIEAVLDEVLSKTAIRLEQRLSEQLEEAAPLITLLAGHASKLHGFDALVEDVLKAWHPPGGFPSNIQPNMLFSMVEPKACVAKGAYLADGTMPKIDQPYTPSVSYWLMIPSTAYADAAKHEVHMLERRELVQIIPEGTKPEATRYYDPVSTGLAGGGTCTLYVKQGVDLQPTKRLRLTPPVRGQQLKVVLTNDRLEIAWDTPPYG